MAALEARTEGWIAALQLAALSMQRRDDAGDFIADFAGDDRHIVDYLVEEVLERQPEQVRDFLLRTSILDRLSGPLCDAVSADHEGGQAMLEALDRANLFVVQLDNRRHWWRYHHLFADVLRAHLAQEQPELVADLHRRASEWYADNARARASHPPRTRRARRRARRGSDRTGGARNAARLPTGRAGRVARLRCRRTSSAPGRCWAPTTRSRCWVWVSSTPRSRCCAMPSDAWTVRRTRRWSLSTKPSCGRCRA